MATNYKFYVLTINEHYYDITSIILPIEYLLDVIFINTTQYFIPRKEIDIKKYIFK